MTAILAFVAVFVVSAIIGVTAAVLINEYREFYGDADSVETPEPEPVCA